jgi:hypothetical protein
VFADGKFFHISIGATPVSPSIATIIAPIEPLQVAWCRDYLRDNAEPRLGSGHAFLECRPLFRFDQITRLHFCSFLILEATDRVGPSLVFEATFDGPKAEFLDDLLRIAPTGFDQIYRCCIGYPASGATTPSLVKEYLNRHDVGANTFFSGNPGRSVPQIKGEHAVRDGIVSFFSTQFWNGAVMPSRPAGLLDLVKHVCICEKDAYRWAEQPAPVPWQVTFRTQVVAVAGLVALLLTFALGAAMCWAFGYPPAEVFRMVPRWLEGANQLVTGQSIGRSALPWLSELARSLSSPTIGALLGLSAVWLLIRAVELILSGASRNTRDQSLIWRFPLQLAVITRLALIAAVIGVVVLTLLSGADHTLKWGGMLEQGLGGVGRTSKALFAVVVQFTIVGIMFLAAWRAATSLKLIVELQPLEPAPERLRRLALDVAQFAMLILAAIGILLIASLSPLAVTRSVAGIVRPVVYWYFFAILLVWIGAMTAYFVGLLALYVVGALEYRDKSRFEKAAPLLARAAENARKYAREEGGINRFQNHLASITEVKPGLLRLSILRFVLFAINLLASLWFNRGELGGIPTILSARWVLIDGGNRLLFLDNYGGAWESYLNEFIDLAAVKGLNAIWTNTFVGVGNKKYGFPATRFLFWKGAQDARPFKAYVRQSQVETIVWYGAYPTFGVVGINANTDIRQSLFGPLTTPSIDRVLQQL